MVLSDIDITHALENQSIQIDPMPDMSIALGSCSIDLQLGNDFRIFEYSKRPYIDTRKKTLPKDVTKEISVSDDESFVLQPGDFVLAITKESVTIPNTLIARLEGRSSLGRLGIVVHSTASMIDAGWSGRIVLELGNLGRMPVALYPGMRICALTFEQLSSPARTPYVAKKHAQFRKQVKP
jgi:dCTP deaminase